MFTRSIIAGFFGAATVLSATAAFAQAPSVQDKMFMVKLCQGNHAEIAAGKLALRKSQNAKVRGLAQTIVSEHSANEAKLQTLADKYNVKLPNEPDAAHKAAAKKLAAMNGKQFDNKYIGGQIADHHATIALLEKEMANGKSSEVRSFATETLGGVQMHTDMIHKVSGTSSNKTMQKMGPDGKMNNKMNGKMGGMKTSMANPASRFNTQLRGLSGVENKSFATPSVTSGASKSQGGTTGGNTVILKPTPQPSRAPGLD